MKLFSGMAVPEMLKQAERYKLLTDHIDVQHHIAAIQLASTIAELPHLQVKENITLPLSNGLPNASPKFNPSFKALDSIRAQEFRSLDKQPVVPPSTVLPPKFKFHPGEFHQVESL